MAGPTVVAASAGGDTPVEALVRVLRAESEAMEALEPLLAAEARALAAGDPAGVLAVIDGARALVDRLAALEQERRRLGEALAAGHGVAARTLTVSRLSALEPAAAPALALVAGRLRTILERTLAKSRRNALLVDDAVRFVERLLATLAPGAPAAIGTYAPTGRVETVRPAPRRVARDA